MTIKNSKLNFLVFILFFDNRLVIVEKSIISIL